MILYTIDVPDPAFPGLIQHHVTDDINAHQEHLDRLHANGIHDAVEGRIK